MAKIAELLEAILNGEEIEDFEPKTKTQAYLKACCMRCGCAGLPNPTTVQGILLYALAEKMAGMKEAEELTVTANGTYTAEEGKAFNPVEVDVEPNLETKSITANGTYTPSEGYDGFGSVDVNVSGDGFQVVTGSYTPTVWNPLNSSIKLKTGDYRATSDIVVGNKRVCKYGILIARDRKNFGADYGVRCLIDWVSDSEQNTNQYEYLNTSNVVNFNSKNIDASTPCGFYVENGNIYFNTLESTMYLARNKQYDYYIVL